MICIAGDSLPNRQASLPALCSGVILPTSDKHLRKRVHCSPLFSAQNPYRSTSAQEYKRKTFCDIPTTSPARTVLCAKSYTGLLSGDLLEGAALAPCGLVLPNLAHTKKLVRSQKRTRHVRWRADRTSWGLLRGQEDRSRPVATNLVWGRAWQGMHVLPPDGTSRDQAPRRARRESRLSPDQTQGGS